MSYFPVQLIALKTIWEKKSPHVAKENNKNYFILHIATPLQICIKWNKERGELIPQDVIYKINEKFDSFNNYNTTRIHDITTGLTHKYSLEGYWISVEFEEVIEEFEFILVMDLWMNLQYFLSSLNINFIVVGLMGVIGAEVAIILFILRLVKKRKSRSMNSRSLS